MIAAAALIVVAAVVAAALWLLAGSDVSDAPADGPPAPEAKAAAKASRSRPPRRRAEPPLDPTPGLLGVWDAAMAQWKAGKPVEALTRLAPLRRSQPAFFADPARIKLLADLEKACVAELARAVRTRSIEEVRKIAAALADGLFDPALAAEAVELLAAAERRAAAAATNPGAAVVERAAEGAERIQLANHLYRFAGEGTAPAKKDWVDDQLAALDAANAVRKDEPVPLPIVDEAAAEKRRLDQLEKLRQRNAVGLLDHIGGALAWLALHQGDDGHFGVDAATAQCKVLKHDPACVAAVSDDKVLGTTGLAVLAFLDFRDQDVKRVFEPTLARAIRWLLAQQLEDGSFKTSEKLRGYAYAISLMALGQATASTGDPSTRDALVRGLAYCAKHAGRDGGYRYEIDNNGDLSVSGWYVQAIEAAGNAGVEVPPVMRGNLDRFLTSVWLGYGQFKYTADKAPSMSMSAVGILSMSILRQGSKEEFGPLWRDYLVKNPPKNNVYALYYSVRVLLALDGVVPDTYRAALDEVAKSQHAKGPSAGLIPLDKDGTYRRSDVGSVAATAFATLTLEHSLYRR